MSFRKKVFWAAFFLLLVCPNFAQESLKSTEEEYYDFLSLTGIVERPTLGYRTLSDSEWIMGEEEISLLDLEGNQILDDDGTPLSQKVKKSHIWENNNLGSKKILWQSENQGENIFTRGFEHNLKLKLYGPEWFNSYNTTSPYGQNDGALWQGKGYNTSLTGGARLEGYGFEVTIKPQVSFSQNLEFDLMEGRNGSEYSYFVPGVDLVQRYGDSSFWDYDWGDTEIRWTWNTLTLGAGYQSPWLGPAWLNPMLGSNNAATYPKIDAGLRKTAVYMPFLGWYVGDIEGRVWLGRLTESDYFEDPANDSSYNMLNALSASFTPSFIPGLTLGANRVFLTRWKTKNFKYFTRLFTLSHDNDVEGDGEDQKASVFVQWLFPAMGFKIYGELGIDDFTSDTTANPLHTAIYTVGVRQNIPLQLNHLHSALPSLHSELICEINNFEMSQDFQFQWPYIGYYGHGKIKEGYTNNGQILGAGSGYFGNSMYFAYKIYHKKGYVQLYTHRFCPNNNYILSKAVGKRVEEINDLYATYNTWKGYGIEALYYFTRSFSTQIDLNTFWIHNVKYEKNENDRNFYFGLRGKWCL